MASNTILPAAGVSAAPLVRHALEALGTAQKELELDFSAVCRLDTAALRELEQLAAQARDRSVTVVLHGVNPDMYKVLKLVALAPRFSFLN